MLEKKTKKGKGVAGRLKNSRDAFDYMVTRSIDIIKKGGSVSSEFSAIVFMPNESTFEIVPIPLDDTVDAEQRKEVMVCAGEDLAEEGADAYVFMAIAEAWTASSKKKTGQMYIRPSTDPDRKEVFIASAEDRTGKVRSISYEIKRKKGEVQLEKISLFGKKQGKFMFDWINLKEIGADKNHSLTRIAWDAYKKKLKEVQYE